MLVVIATTGTSLLTNWRKRTEAETGAWPSGQELLDFLRSHQDSCAEQSSLRKLEIKNRDHIHLVGSDTRACRLCLQALEQYYQEQGIHYVFFYPVPQLVESNYRSFQEQGLPKLHERLSSIHEQHRDHQVIINATGGFKAQTAFATLYGLLFGLEVVYMYEDFNNLMRFPPLPISCDQRWLNEYGETFTRILQAPSRKEGLAIIRTLPVEVRGFFEKSDQGYRYSTIGRMFIDACRLRQIDKQYVVRTYKQHSSLWGDGINSLEEINDRKVRELFRRLFDCAPHLNAIYLDEMKTGKTRDTRMEYVETVNNALRYLLKTPLGCQYIKLECVPNMENEVLRLLGRKIYA